MTDSNYDHYEELCGGLEQLATEFEIALDRFGPVHHRLIHSERAVSAVGWQNFAEAYRKSATADTEQWEEWRPHPNGMACSYFFGRGSKANLEEFTRLADSGYVLLLELAALQAESGIPPDADILLPEKYRGSNWDLSNRHFDWLLVLHDTAMGCHTVRLRDHVGFWGYSHDGSSSEVEQAQVIEQLVETWSGSEPDRFPLHPMTESLQHDLFVSSAEAIHIWLDPYDEEIVPVGKGIEESPIYLPEPGEDDAARLVESAIELPEAKSVSDNDLVLAASLSPEPEVDVALKPHWDAAMRQLWVGQKLIKWFKRQRAPNQITLLQAFEAQGWPTSPIDNPITEKRNEWSIKLLNDTIKGLNKHHETEGVLLACSPKTDPCGMRVSSALWGKEILDETQEAQAGADCHEAA